MRGDLNVRDLAHATRSMFIPQSKHREGLNDERLRQDLEAKQLRHEARMMKGKEDQTRMQPAPQRKLGAGGDRSHIKQFVFEEDDEVQEMRISDKTDELLEATFYAKAEAVELGKDIEKDNALIASMSERVCDSEPTQLRRQKTNRVHRAIESMTSCWQHATA